MRQGRKIQSVQDVQDAQQIDYYLKIYEQSFFHKVFEVCQIGQLIDHIPVIILLHIRLCLEFVHIQIYVVWRRWVH